MIIMMRQLLAMKSCNVKKVRRILRVYRESVPFSERVVDLEQNSAQKNGVNITRETPLAQQRTPIRRKLHGGSRRTDGNRPRPCALSFICPSSCALRLAQRLRRSKRENAAAEENAKIACKGSHGLT